MALHVLKKTSFKKVMAGLLTGFLAVSFAQTSAFAAESPEERAATKEYYREWASEQPVRKYTVLIVTDQEYRDAHPDWIERTTNLVKEGTKDFNEYFNVEFVPVQYWKGWKSSTDNIDSMMEDLRNQFNEYVNTKMDKNLNFNHVIAFTGKRKGVTNVGYDAAGTATTPVKGALEENVYGKVNVLAFAKKHMNMDPEQYSFEEILAMFKKIPNVGFTVICDTDNPQKPQSALVKHELSHNYGVQDDKFGERNSIMSYTWPGDNEGKPRSTDWSSDEMYKIYKYVDKNVYLNREVEEVANINENLTFYKTGNLFFTQIKGSLTDEVGSYEKGYLQTDADTDLEPGIDFFKHDLVQNVSNRFNQASVIGNNLVFSSYGLEE